MSDLWISVARVAVVMVFLAWVVPMVLILLTPTGFIRDIRFPGWKFPRSKEQAKVDKALDKAFRRAGQVSGVPAAIDRVKTDDGPLTVDTVLLLPGEVAVFDASGALVVWFPAPGSDVGSVVCQKSVTILTYADMPQATPRMRDQLRLLKGGREHAADK